VQGSYTNPVPILGAGSFNSIASSVPIGGSFTNATVGITPRDGDEVLSWNVGIQDLDGTIATYSTFSSTWSTTAINVNPGIGFFYVGAGPNQNPWVRNFTVP